jgi:hypothetical protein
MKVSTKENIQERCVITFFGCVIADMLSKGFLEQVSEFRCETVVLPLYKTMRGETPVCLIQGFVGAANSASMLEELIGLGIKKFIVCGEAGVLQRGFRSDIWSYHTRRYKTRVFPIIIIAPSREI